MGLLIHGPTGSAPPDPVAVAPVVDCGSLSPLLPLPRCGDLCLGHSPKSAPQPPPFSPAALSSTRQQHHGRHHAQPPTQEGEVQLQGTTLPAAGRTTESGDQRPSRSVSQPQPATQRARWQNGAASARRTSFKLAKRNYTHADQRSTTRGPLRCISPVLLRWPSVAAALSRRPLWQV